MIITQSQSVNGDAGLVEDERSEYMLVEDEDESIIEAEENLSAEFDELSRKYLNHPDDDPPSKIHTEKFKDLYYNFEMLRWEEFECAVKKFTNDLRDHVKITANPSTSFKPRSINENDPAVLQRL